MGHILYIQLHFLPRIVRPLIRFRLLRVSFFFPFRPFSFETAYSRNCCSLYCIHPFPRRSDTHESHLSICKPDPLRDHREFCFLVFLGCVLGTRLLSQTVQRSVIPLSPFVDRFSADMVLNRCSCYSCRSAYPKHFATAIARPCYSVIAKTCPSFSIRFSHLHTSMRSQVLLLYIVTPCMLSIHSSAIVVPILFEGALG